MTTYTAEVDDSILMIEDRNPPFVYGSTLVDTARLGSTFGFGYGHIFSETLQFREAILKFDSRLAGVVTDALVIKDQPMDMDAVFTRAISDVLQFLDTPGHLQLATIIESFGVHAVLVLARTGNIHEKLRFSETLTPNSTQGALLADILQFEAAVSDFFGRDYDQAFGFGDTASYQAILSRAVVDHVGIDAALTASGLFMRVVTDGILLEDEDALWALYNETLLDCVQFAIATILPGTGNLSTWAINTRTNAVTEYQGTPSFNSYVYLNNILHGLNSDGLYRLDAQTDLGENIVADVKGAMLSLGDSRFTQLDGVYLGMRADTNGRTFLLKIIVPGAGQGATDAVYVYSFNPRNQRTTRINIGKGLRTRYLQWELVTDGTDFDLDSLEFIPIVSRRRI